jgi:hypothetical protein
VTFIGSAHGVIEADFNAVELVGDLREQVKRLPSRYVTAQGRAAADADPLRVLWDRLTAQLDRIRASSARLPIEPRILEAVTRTFNAAAEEYRETEAVASGAADLDTLIERAVFVDRALASSSGCGTGRFCNRLGLRNDGSERQVLRLYCLPALERKCHGNRRIVMAIAASERSRWRASRKGVAVALARH